MFDLKMKMMDDQMRVSPDVLSRALGCKCPNELNRFIAENMKDMLEYDDVCSFTTCGFESEPEYWLTETQALLIATRIGTPAAQAFTVHMIKTIMPIVRGVRHV